MVAGGAPRVSHASFRGGVGGASSAFGGFVRPLRLERGGSLLRFLFPLGGRGGPAGGPRSGPRAWSRGANLMEFSIEWSETTR